MEKSKKQKIRDAINDYIAKGGTFTKFPPQEAEESYVIKPITQPQIMPLDHGELFFTQKQKRNKKSDEERNQEGRDKLSEQALQYLNSKD